MLWSSSGVKYPSPYHHFRHFHGKRDPDRRTRNLSTTFRYFRWENGLDHLIGYLAWNLLLYCHHKQWKGEKPRIQQSPSMKNPDCAAGRKTLPYKLFALTVLRSHFQKKMNCCCFYISNGFMKIGKNYRSNLWRTSFLLP
jgi:hypothetical protein